MNIRIGQQFKINEQLTIQITELDDDYIYFAEYENGKYGANRNIKREHLNLQASQLLSGFFYIRSKLKQHEKTPT